MKFQVEMTDNDGGFIAFDVQADKWQDAATKAEENHPGWEVIVITNPEQMSLISEPEAQALMDDANREKGIDPWWKT